MWKFLYLFVVMTIIGIFYDKYKRKNELTDELKNQKLIQKYLLNDSTTLSDKKPILWLHRKYETNARHWPSFFSRNTTDLNQPYIHLCVKSVIKNCSNSFNICLIDDDSFKKIIPGWNIEIKNLANPIKTHMRRIAISKLLYYYGGMVLPNSTVVLKDLFPLYEESTEKYGCFVGEMVNRTSTSENIDFFPSSQILGCKKNNMMMKMFIRYLEELNMTDNTNESDFLGQGDRWLYQQYVTKKMVLIDGKCLGTKTLEGKQVLIEDLLSKNRIEFDDRVLACIIIPSAEILHRTNYQWFARLSAKQLLISDMIISKYMLICQ